MKTQVQSSLRLVQLIDMAATMAGNDARLAEQLEESRHNLSSWKHGRRSCPIEAQILMAEIAKLNVCEVMGSAIIEKHKGTTKGERLKRALKSSAEIPVFQATV